MSLFSSSSQRRRKSTTPFPGGDGDGHGYSSNNSNNNNNSSNSVLWGRGSSGASPSPLLPTFDNSLTSTSSLVPSSPFATKSIKTTTTTTAAAASITSSNNHSGSGNNSNGSYINHGSNNSGGGGNYYSGMSSTAPPKNLNSNNHFLLGGQYYPGKDKKHHHQHQQYHHHHRPPYNAAAAGRSSSTTSQQQQYHRRKRHSTSSSSWFFSARPVTLPRMVGMVTLMACVGWIVIRYLLFPLLSTLYHTIVWILWFVAAGGRATSSSSSSMNHNGLPSYDTLVVGKKRLALHDASVLVGNSHNALPMKANSNNKWSSTFSSQRDKNRNSNRILPWQETLEQDSILQQPAHIAERMQLLQAIVPRWYHRHDTTAVIPGTSQQKQQQPHHFDETIVVPGPRPITLEGEVSDAAADPAGHQQSNHQVDAKEVTNNKNEQDAQQQVEQQQQDEHLLIAANLVQDKASPRKEDIDIQKQQQQKQQLNHNSQPHSPVRLDNSSRRQSKGAVQEQQQPDTPIAQQHVKNQQPPESKGEAAQLQQQQNEPSERSSNADKQQRINSEHVVQELQSGEDAVLKQPPLVAVAINASDHNHTGSLETLSKDRLLKDEKGHGAVVDQIAANPVKQEQRPSLLRTLHTVYQFANRTQCPLVLPADQIQTTLVMQSSLDRLWIVRETCARWKDPIVIVVAIPNQNAAIAKEQFSMESTALHEVCTASDSRNALSPQLVMIPYLMTAHESQPEHYPVNVMRNLALDAVQTSHVLVTDVDFVPSAQLADLIQGTLHERSLLRRFRPQQLPSDSTEAMVIPAFERIVSAPCSSNAECRQYWQHDPSFLPSTTETLHSCLQHHQCQVFQADVNPAGHSATRTTEWLQGQWYNDSVSWRYNTTRTIHAIRDIPCFDTLRYEPYVVVRWCPSSSSLSSQDLLDRDPLKQQQLQQQRPVAPYYDERFHGYGKNKIQHVQHLRVMGYRFVVMPEGFLIHAPHVESQAKQVWNQHVNNNNNVNNGSSVAQSANLHQEMDELYRIFLMELLDKYQAQIEQGIVEMCSHDKIQ